MASNTEQQNRLVKNMAFLRVIHHVLYVGLPTLKKKLMVYVSFVFFAFSLCATECACDKDIPEQTIRWFGKGGSLITYPLPPPYPLNAYGEIFITLASQEQEENRPFAPGSIIVSQRFWKNICSFSAKMFIAQHSATLECVYCEAQGRTSVTTITAHTPSSQEDVGRLMITPPHKQTSQKVLVDLASKAPRASAPECQYVCFCDEKHAEWTWLVFRCRDNTQFFIKFDINYVDLSNVMVSWGHARCDANSQDFSTLSIKQEQLFAF